ncbi:Aldehyde dehydrogenase family protein [Halopelagius inordinatus]|uniref:Aldehyde dehydrogenase family protein n=1 Tax=Halopelagius inordinatus TaxID=553467 RepID=A0A1I2VV43_9EURY|nr:Aldehyde dehydrogenase family protein [Halopelagius inordinatus]
MPPEARNYVNGEWVESRSGETFAVRNPASPGEVVSRQQASPGDDVDYGLSASIVTQDLTEAKRFVHDVEAGVAKVNEKTTGLELHVPFGGYKDSSTNTYREQGDAGLNFYTSVKTAYENY